MGIEEDILKIESSSEGSVPIEIYHLQSHEKSWFFTSYVEDIVISSGPGGGISTEDVLTISDNATSLNKRKPYPGTYLASNLKRSSVAQNTHTRYQKSLSITIPFDSSSGPTKEIAQRFMYGTTPNELSIFVYRLYSVDDNAHLIPNESAMSNAGKYYGRLFWVGQADNLKVTNNISLDITCYSTFYKIMNLKVPNIKYQPTCNHILFDKRCRVERSEYLWVVSLRPDTNDKRLLNVTQISKHPFRDNFSDVDVNYFRHGTLSIIQDTDTIDKKTISQSSSTAIRLSFPLSFDIADNTAALLTPGCQHNLSDCKEKFNNLDNFAGFPHIPYSIGN